MIRMTIGWEQDLLDGEPLVFASFFSNDRSNFHSPSDCKDNGELQQQVVCFAWFGLMTIAQKLFNTKESTQGFGQLVESLIKHSFLETMGAFNAAEVKIVQTLKNDPQIIASVRRLVGCKIIQLARSLVLLALTVLPEGSIERKRLQFLLMETLDDNSKYFHPHKSRNLTLSVFQQLPIRLRKLAPCERSSRAP